MSQTKGRGSQGIGRMVSHFFDCAIHQRTKQSEVFGTLFNADEALTSLYMFMSAGQSCDESYQGEGGLMIVVIGRGHPKTLII